MRDEMPMFDEIKMKIMIARARREQRRMSADVQEKGREVEEDAPLAPSDPDGYEVFKKVCPGTGLLVFEPVAWIALIVVFFIVLYLHALFLPIVIGILLLLQVSQIALNRLRYRFFFKGWHRRLPYPLYGWEELVRSKRMYADLCWTDCEIIAESGETSDECLNFVKAALLLYCKKANSEFYERKSGFPQDYRKEWSIDTGSSAAGSANTGVMRRMKGLLGRDLAMIARKSRCISAVRILIKSEEYEVPIEIRSSEGPAS